MKKSLWGVPRQFTPVRSPGESQVTASHPEREGILEYVKN